MRRVIQCDNLRNARWIKVRSQSCRRWVWPRISRNVRPRWCWFWRWWGARRRRRWRTGSNVSRFSRTRWGWDRSRNWSSRKAGSSRSRSAGSRDESRSSCCRGSCSSCWYWRSQTGKGWADAASWKKPRIQGDVEWLRWNNAGFIGGTQGQSTLEKRSEIGAPILSITLVFFRTLLKTQLNRAPPDKNSEILNAMSFIHLTNIRTVFANHLQNLGLLSSRVNNLLDDQQPAPADTCEKEIVAFLFAFVDATRPELKAVFSDVERLENDLCNGISIEHVPCPVPGARLAFYITSLTKPDTKEVRNAKKQLQLALPLNLFLCLHARKWTSFYVQNLSSYFFLNTIDQSTASYTSINNSQ